MEVDKLPFIENDALLQEADILHLCVPEIPAVERRRKLIDPEVADPVISPVFREDTEVVRQLYLPGKLTQTFHIHAILVGGGGSRN